jgi:hypothetical protein
MTAKFNPETCSITDGEYTTFIEVYLAPAHAYKTPTVIVSVFSDADDAKISKKIAPEKVGAIIEKIINDIFPMYREYMIAKAAGDTDTVYKIHPKISRIAMGI